MIPCVHVFMDTHRRCLSGPDDHVHDSTGCANDKFERHHEYAPEPPHEHVFDRCICGKREQEER